VAFLYKEARMKESGAFKERAGRVKETRFRAAKLRSEALAQRQGTRE